MQLEGTQMALKNILPLACSSRRALTALALGAIFLATSLAQAACTTVTTPQSPGAMNLDLKIKYYQQGETPVEAHFSTTDGNTIEFVSGETVACDNVFLAYDSNPVEQLFDYGSYLGDVPMQPATGVYTFTYTPAKGKGAPITLSVPVVNDPVNVTSPANGAAVNLPSNGGNVTIHYTPGTVANSSVLAILTDSRGKVTLTLPQPDNGVLQVPASSLNGFQPGPGTIYVVRVTTNSPAGT